MGGGEPKAGQERTNSLPKVLTTFFVDSLGDTGGTEEGLKHEKVNQCLSKKCICLKKLMFNVNVIVLVFIVKKTRLWFVVQNCVCASTIFFKESNAIINKKCSMAILIK